jgi:hypothetical protein
MGTLPNFDELLKNILGAASTSIGNDVSTIKTFSKQQAEDIAALTIDVYEMIDDGEFDDDPDEQTKYLRILSNLTHNLARTLEALGQIAVEKAWNAMVDVIWKTLEKAAGIPLPRL